MHLIGPALEKQLIRQVHRGTEKRPRTLVESVMGLDVSKPGPGEECPDLAGRVDPHMPHVSQAVQLVKLSIGVVKPASLEERGNALERVEVGRTQHQRTAWPQDPADLGQSGDRVDAKMFEHFVEQNETKARPLERETFPFDIAFDNRQRVLANDG